MINFIEYTGNYTINKTLFGKHKIMLECIGSVTDWHDCSESPTFNYWKKATLQDLSNFNLNLK